MIKTLCLIMIFLCSGIALSGYAQDNSVRISSGEYAPWTSASAPHGGFVNHLISEAFKQKGYTVSFDYLPWKRAYLMAKNGEYQATSFWADTEKEYSEFFYRSLPVMQAKVVFFHLRSKPMRKWEKMTDLKDYRIGTMIGETSTKMLEDAGLKVDNAPKTEHCFKKLLAGRIDIFPLDVLTGLEFLQTQFTVDQADLISYDARPLFETSASLMFPKCMGNSEALVAIFNQGLTILKNEGRYDELYNDLLDGKYRQ
ncbi:substrate-binding periplasmic protein [Desulfamplus magnetovallimortis]|nr:transporter substrate-binding domain-containing protein [Desulfamplus magnetovallimortis]